MKNIKKTIVTAVLLSILIIPSFASAATTAELQAQISALLAQIQQLQAQLAQQTGDEAPQWCHTFAANLKIGSKGEEVKALQIALEKEGFEIGADKGYFGTKTASAVTGFQQKYKRYVLTPVGLKYGTGFFGPSTRAKINELYGCGIIQPPIEIPGPIPSPVPPINKPPVIHGVSGPTTLDVGKKGVWTVRASDPEQGRLTYRVVWGDEIAYFDGARPLSEPHAYTQTATFTHTYSSAGVYYPSFTVTDSAGQTARTSISVRVGSDKTIDALKAQIQSLLAVVANLQKKLSECQNPFSLRESEGISSDAESSLSNSSSTIEELQKHISALLAIISNLQAQLNACEKPSSPSITVISPNGGESWEIGKTYDIVWTSENAELPNSTFGKTVVIELTKEKQKIYGIATSGLIDGAQLKFPWTIPSDIALGTYLVRISTVTDGQNPDFRVYDYSDRYFSIVKEEWNEVGEISVSLDPSSPDPRTVTGGSQNVTATVLRFSAAYENIHLRQIGFQFDGSNVAALQKYTVWDGATKVGEGLFTGTSRTSRVVLTQPVIISKNSSKLLTIKVDLARTGRTYPAQVGDTVAVNYDGDNWKNTKGIGQSTGVTIYSGAKNDTSASKITLGNTINPSITVISPNGGEKWEAGKTYEIKWNTINAPSNSWVALILKKGNDMGQLIKQGISSANNYFSWSVPSTYCYGGDACVPINPGRALSDDFTIEARLYTGPSLCWGDCLPGRPQPTFLVSDKSNAAFSIVGTGVKLTLTASSGAQPAQTIAFRGQQNIPYTTVNLTASGGDVSISSFTVERTGIGNDAAFLWISILDENGNVLGKSLLNANHQAVITASLNVNGGQTKKITIAADRSTNTGYGGQTAYFPLMSVISNAETVAGLPITGTGHTLSDVSMDEVGYSPQINQMANSLQAAQGILEKMIESLKSW